MTALLLNVQAIQPIQTAAFVEAKSATITSSATTTGTSYTRDAECFQLDLIEND